MNGLSGDAIYYPVPPYFLLQKYSRESGRRGKPESEPVEEDTRDRPVLCRECRNLITFHHHKIEVDSSFRHTFFNPAGIVYEIGCFKEAKGCYIQGRGETEFSWFGNAVWKYAHCGVCLEHLGWHYTTSLTSFYGLILSQLLFWE